MSLELSDILWVACAAIAQAVTSFLGWRVTVDGVKKERKRLYEFIFIAAAVCGIIATIVAASRTANLVGQLHGKMHIDQFWFAIPGGQANNPMVAVGREVTGIARSTNRGLCLSNILPLHVS